MDHAAGLTDLVLSVASLYAAFRALRSPGWIGGVGLGILGTAAGLGFIRFSVNAMAEPYHGMATWLAGAVGVPLIGLGLYSRHRELLGQYAFLICVNLSVLSIAASVGGKDQVARVVVNATAMLLGIWASYQRRSTLGMVGPALVIAAGLVVPPVSAALGVDHIPGFHLVMAGAAVVLGLALAED